MGIGGGLVGRWGSVVYILKRDLYECKTLKLTS